MNIIISIPYADSLVVGCCYHRQRARSLDSKLWETQKRVGVRKKKFLLSNFVTQWCPSGRVGWVAWGQSLGQIWECQTVLFCLWDWNLLAITLIAVTPRPVTRESPPGVKFLPLLAAQWAGWHRSPLRMWPTRLHMSLEIWQQDDQWHYSPYLQMSWPMQSPSGQMIWIHPVGILVIFAWCNWWLPVQVKELKRLNKMVA